MNTKNLTITDVIQANIKQLYKAILMLREKDKDGMEETYQQARNGIKEKFDIEDLFGNKFTKKIKAGTVTIKNKRMKIDDFRTEIEKREDIMKTTIIKEINKRQQI